MYKGPESMVAFGAVRSTWGAVGGKRISRNELETVTALVVLFHFTQHNLRFAGDQK